jgi:hypothetical protein
MIRSQSFPVHTPASRAMSVTVLCFCLFHFWTPFSVWALDPVLIDEQEVVPGLDFLRYEITQPGTKAVHVLRLDYGRPELGLRVGFAHATVKNTREPTSLIAQRYQAPDLQVLAAINGSFFQEDGTPAGALMDGGSLLTTFRGWNRVAFGWTAAHQPLSEDGLSASGSHIIFSDGSEHTIHGINHPRSDHQLVLYTPEYDVSTGTAPAGVELTVRGINFPLSPRKEVTGTISGVSSDIGNQGIPGDAVVLSAAGQAAPALIRHATIGDQVRIRIGFSDPMWNAVDTMITGGGWLIHDGTPPTELWNRYNEGFRNLHPRTLVGWNSEFLYLVAVDGRQVGYSEGMTFAEIAEFMKDTLNCREAINFDGGGSTTMVVRGEVVNRPSDGAERAVPTVLLVVRDLSRSSLPLEDSFIPAGRQPFWRDRFTMNPVEAFRPAAPEGDGTVMRVVDPSGGFESVRVGKLTDRDYSVSAWFYCDFRPELAGLGFDRVGLFARDAGDGAFDSPAAGSSNCYALMWDSDDGRLRAGHFLDGRWEDFPGEEKYLPSTAWRRFQIDCRGERISFFVDGDLLVEATDAAHPSGPCGIAYREEFSDNEHIGGAVVEDFRMAPVSP